VQVEPEAIVAAGAVVKEGTHIPSGQVWGGNPAAMLRALKPEEKAYLKNLPSAYTALGGHHQDILSAMSTRMEQIARPAS
jgi:gamma-carbonic anhydrase